MTNQLSAQTVAHAPVDSSPFGGGEAFVHAQRVAKALSSSGLMPKEYQGPNNIPNVLIAMEVAHRIGASPFAVAQSLDIIHGRPSWRASALIAMVNACGRFTPIRFRFQGKEGTPSWGCRAVAKDKESGEECVGTLITIGMAQAEGWATKSGSKWKTMPELMLQYRAAAFWARVYAPELSLGMHTAEERQDVMSAAPVRAQPEAFRAIEAQLQPAAEAEVSDDADDADSGMPPEDLERLQSAELAEAAATEHI